MNEDFNLILNKHHALLLEADKSTAFNLRNFLKDENDIFFIEKDEINIEDAGLIKQNAVLKPAYGDFRILIISTGKFGREAEQSLLKILEEPPRETKIILVTPNSKFLSPTILSRVIKIKSERLEPNEEVLEFLKKTQLERQKEVENILKDENVNIFSFLNNLEESITSNNLAQEKDWRDSIGDIYEAKRALQIPGSSKKQILEYLALTMPKFK